MAARTVKSVGRHLVEPVEKREVGVGFKGGKDFLSLLLSKPGKRVDTLI